jgi:putative ABC transport system permease protein
VYRPAAQWPSHSCVVVVRSGRPAADAATVVREEVARLDRDLPVYGIRALEDVVATSPGVPARRVLAAAFTGFALLAVVLGGIGLFGVVAHDVACRRAELALRATLGAEPRRILGATVSQGASMVGAGLALGGVLTIGAVRALRGLLFGTGPLDPVSLALASITLLLVAAAAVLPTARRAARTDPLAILRGE